MHQFSVYTISVSTCLLCFLDILCVWDEPRAVAWPLDGGSHTYLHGAGCNTNLRVAQQQVPRLHCTVHAACSVLWVVLDAACSVPRWRRHVDVGMNRNVIGPVAHAPALASKQGMPAAIMRRRRLVRRVRTVPRSLQCHSMLLLLCCIVHYHTGCTYLFS
jgi:hypothetical protein